MQEKLKYIVLKNILRAFCLFIVFIVGMRFGLKASWILRGIITFVIVVYICIIILHSLLLLFKVINKRDIKIIRDMKYIRYVWLCTKIHYPKTSYFRRILKFADCMRINKDATIKRIDDIDKYLEDYYKTENHESNI